MEKMTMETALEKSEYLLKEDLEDFYDRCKQWLSETEFWSDELRFLQNLFSQYFSDMTTAHKLGELDAITKNLGLSSTKVKDIHEKIFKQEEQVFELIENAFSHDEQAFRDSHEVLKKELETLHSEIRELKKKIYSYAEEVMKKKRSKEKKYLV